jgi:hypothetical protein
MTGMILASGGGTDLTSLLGPILSTGLVGVFLVLLMFEIGIVPKKALDRALKSKDDATLPTPVSRVVVRIG